MRKKERLEETNATYLFLGVNTGNTVRVQPRVTLLTAGLSVHYEKRSTNIKECLNSGAVN